MARLIRVRVGRPPVDPPEGATATTMQSSVTQDGITVTFDQEYPVGQYANGDYFVVGPIDVIGFTPASVNDDGWVKHGAMINPVPGGVTPDTPIIGYGTVRATSYDQGLNAAWGVTAGNPLTVPAGSSLIPTISSDVFNSVPGIKNAIVLTVVSAAPSQGAFRPPYCGTDKTSYHNEADLDYSLLPTLAPVGGEPDLVVAADFFRRVWLDHVPRWNGRKIHPSANMPNYGRNLAARLGKGYLALMLNYSNQQKRDLLVNLVQTGIDFYGIADNGPGVTWVPDGGHAQGRKLPILFAGHLLGDTAMSNIGQRDEIFFGEDAQTFYVTQEEVDMDVGYTVDDIGLAEWAIRFQTSDQPPDPDWERSYRQCCTANSWHGHVLVARILGLKAAWNHDPLFDYTDRFMQRQLDDGADSWERSWQRPFSENMWDTYRSSY